MDKQKKQLIILVVLLVGMGGFALFQFGVFDSAPAPAPQPTKSAEAEPQAPPAPTDSASAPVVADQDLQMPTEAFEYKPQEYSWAPEVGKDRGGRNWTPGDDELFPFDPLRVKNVDIVNPELRRYIDEVKRNWIVKGITRTWQVVTESIPIEEPEEEGTEEAGTEGDAPVNNEDETQPQEQPGSSDEVPGDAVPEDQPEDEEEAEKKFREVKRWRLVTEVWFEGRRAPFRKNDRLTGTRFVINEIVFGRDRKDPNLTPRALVRLLGDSGEQLDLELAPAGRYGEDDVRSGR